MVTCSTSRWERGRKTAWNQTRALIRAAWLGENTRPVHQLLNLSSYAFCHSMRFSHKPASTLSLSLSRLVIAQECVWVCNTSSVLSVVHFIVEGQSSGQSTSPPVTPESWTSAPWNQRLDHSRGAMFVWNDFAILELTCSRTNLPSSMRVIITQTLKRWGFFFFLNDLLKVSRCWYKYFSHDR